MPNPGNHREVRGGDFDLSPERATAVISSAQKFIIPVPDFGDRGEPLLHPNTGEPIRDWQGKPVGATGIVFFNGTDRTPQAAPGDGSGVVIINQVTAVEAEALHRKIREYVDDPHQLSLDQLKSVLSFARERLLLTDMYNSSRDFIAAKMSPVGSEVGGAGGSRIECFGLMKRDDRDICYAVFVRGAVALTTASPGEGGERTHHFDRGGVVLRQGSDIRGIQPDVFASTYRLADGSPIQDPARDLAWAEPQ